MKGNLEAVRREVDTKAAAQAKAVRKVASEREEADRRLRLLLEDVAAGGLTLETVGLVWLLLGTVFDFLGPEMIRYASLLRWC